MRKILGAKFFDRPAPKVARDLIGKYLVRRIGTRKIAEMITETEAYYGPNDKASHASKGRTKRTEVLFGHGGHWYVYFVYGMHHLLNIVTGPKDFPAAVLIRATKETQGPGRLTSRFQVDKSFYALPAVRKSDLWIEDRGAHPVKFKIRRTPRIGVGYAGPIWSKKLYRYVAIF